MSYSSPFAASCPCFHWGPSTWVKYPALGPWFSLLSARTHPWRFYLARPPPEGFHFDSDQKAYLQLHRCQFPLTNRFAMIHYNLQGQTLPSIILDLAKPPQMRAISRPIIFSFSFRFRDSFAEITSRICIPHKWAEDKYSLYMLRSTPRTPHSTLYTLHFTLYTLHTTLYTLHSIPYTILFTLFPRHQASTSICNLHPAGSFA